MIDDVTSVALHSALDGLSARQRVIADNVANINTPGFLAGRVQFEGALSDAVANGGSPDVTPTVGRSLEPTNTNGNNVNLDEETLDGSKANMSYQLVLEALGAKYSLMRTVLNGS